MGCAKDIFELRLYIIFESRESLQVQLKRKRFMTIRPLNAFPIFAAMLFPMFFSGQTVHAQVYPSKTISIIVPAAAGGIADLVARVFAAKIGETNNARVIVVDKSGGGGVPGTATVVSAKPDGYTLLSTYEGPVSVMPQLQKLSYDPAKDLVPIVHLLSAPNFLVISSSVPVNNLAELIAYAKDNPGKLTYASQGVGSTGHLAGEMLKLAAGIDITHVPYRGAAPATQDLLAGNVSMIFSLFASVQPYLTSGKMRIIGVATKDRATFMPEVPTLIEQGIPIEMAAWFGLLAPAGTPAEVISWLNERANSLMSTPDVQARFIAQGATLPLGTPDAFGKFISAETQKFGEVIRRANISISER
jgi:tripartite-type tricarboxylate transporter receptor subunit TctC